MLSREILLNALAFSKRVSLKTISAFEIGSKSPHSVPAFPRAVAEDGNVTPPKIKTNYYSAQRLVLQKELLTKKDLQKNLEVRNIREVNDTSLFI
ncbi:hypothetical protein EGT49_08555 [Companilactobacillus suantsaicola]|uniref:Uncharacterized protein n=1 Tax=Companilactobacillus suantsaicola TaxID=2487723 RepID=A0A4Z0JI99_9LACO|nr:hypothetical protein EGT49_08555 [Companilactobacillus suantsaicola]